MAEPGALAAIWVCRYWLPNASIASDDGQDLNAGHVDTSAKAIAFPIDAKLRLGEGTAPDGNPRLAPPNAATVDLGLLNQFRRHERQLRILRSDSARSSRHQHKIED